MQPPPQAPYLGSAEPPSSVSYQGVILVLHSLMTLYSRSRYLSTVVLKVRSRATIRCPRAVLRRERQGGCDQRFLRAWPLLVSRESYQTTKKSSSTKSTRETR